MGRPEAGRDLQVFLEVTEEAISAALVQEEPQFKLIYFVSRSLKEADQQLEKVALSLLYAVLCNWGRLIPKRICYAPHEMPGGNRGRIRHEGAARRSVRKAHRRTSAQGPGFESGFLLACVREGLHEFRAKVLSLPEAWKYLPRPND